MDQRHLMITGLPGTGKTTLLIELARRFSRFHPTGFFTREVRERDERRGFRLTSLDGREGLLADVELPGPHRVGRYGVDLKGFESFLTTLDLLSAPSRLVFIDEIGKMECLSPEFISLVMSLLASDKTVVATVARKAGGVIKEVRERPDLHLVEVTHSNRQDLPDQLTRWLENALKR